MGANMAGSDTQEKSLSAEQRRAIDALLAGSHHAAAAKAAGCSERTLHRWKREPTFAAALRGAQDAALDETAGALVSGSRASVALLHSVVVNQSAQMSHRLRAAATLLDAALRWHELRNLSQRVQALEERTNAQTR